MAAVRPVYCLLSMRFDVLPTDFMGALSWYGYLQLDISECVNENLYLELETLELFTFFL